VFSVESLQTVRKNISPQHSGLTNKPSKKSALLGLCFQAGFLLGLFLNPEDGDVPPKRRLIFKRLHGIIFQKIVLFTTNTARTSNPTQLRNF
jgi:hypothetical protein